MAECPITRAICRVKHLHWINPTWRSDYEFDITALSQKFTDIRSVNDQLIARDIPCLIISVEKNRLGHIRELHQQICESGMVEGIKLILYVEHTVNAKDLPVALWRFCNNLDPRRDSHLVQLPAKHQPGKTWACMGLDGTIKTKAFDNFQRDWPNIIVADTTILRLPEGFTMEALPKSKEMSCPYATYTTKYWFNEEQKAIYSTATLVLKQHKIPAAGYAEVKKFFDEILLDDAQRIVIKKL